MMIRESWDVLNWAEKHWRTKDGNMEKTENDKKGRISAYTG